MCSAGWSARSARAGRSSRSWPFWIVDALGNPLAISLTGGQVHDITQAEALVALVEPEALLADKGYDADHFVERLKVRAIKPVIPPKSNRKIKRDCDFALVERFFNIIKHFRATATRYEKTARFSPVSTWSAPSLGLNDDTP